MCLFGDTLFLFSFLLFDLIRLFGLAKEFYRFIRGFFDYAQNDRWRPFGYALRHSNNFLKGAQTVASLGQGEKRGFFDYAQNDKDPSATLRVTVEGKEQTFRLCFG